MSRSKSRHVGAGVLTRYHDDSCTFACNHSGCGAYTQPRGWRAGLRQARQHAAAHDATEARYVGTPWGIPTHELPPTRRQRPLRRLAVAVLVPALTALALTLTTTVMTGRAAPPPASPSTTILPTTTLSTTAWPGPEGYVPTPPGPPAPTPTSSSAGGDR
jgi:hypothetical protein